MDELVFLIDFDGTLFDSEAMKRAFTRVIEAHDGPGSSRFWQTYESVRGAAGVVDWLTTIDLYGRETRAYDLADRLRSSLFTLPFKEFILPGAFEALAHLGTMGRTVVLSAGKPTFQVHKIEVSGVSAAVEGRVLVFPRKEEHGPEIQARFPAARYVAIDDRAEILTRLRDTFGACLSTVLVGSGIPVLPRRADAHAGSIADLASFSIPP